MIDGLTDIEIAQAFPEGCVEFPRIDPSCVAAFPEEARLIAAVGLPAEIGDWFQAVERLSLAGVQPGISLGSTRQRELLVGKNLDFGVYVVEGAGAVMYVDESGATQRINSGLREFLAFSALFLAEAQRGFRDVAKLRQKLVEIDPGPFQDPEGVWSYMLESAEAGLYG